MRLLFKWLTEQNQEVLYIGGAEVLPEPLDAEREKYYIDLFRETKDKEAKEKLIEHNLRLVAHIVKKYQTANRSSEDLISIGTIGLIKGISTFDPSKGARLATYAARCVENAILS